MTEDQLEQEALGWLAEAQAAAEETMALTACPKSL